MNRLRGFWMALTLSLCAVMLSSCCDDDDEETRYISTAAQLIAFCEDVNDDDDDDDYEVDLNAVLTADIDLAGYEWTPIAKNQFYPYEGTFNGNGYSIKNLTISAPDQPNKALIGYMSEGTIKNLTIENPQIEGGEYVGAVCAQAFFESTISNCKVVGGSISGTSFVGGIVGSASWTPITNCYNEETDITGLSEVGYNIGGVAGSSSSSTVSGCYNTGSVKGMGNYYGGVVGYTYFTSLLGSYNTGEVSTTGKNVGGVTGNVSTYIVACYNTAAVSGGEFVGGVVGSIGSQYTDLSSYITACYNTGDVSTTGSYAAGVVGQGDSSTTFSSCYFNNSATMAGAYIYDSSSYDSDPPVYDAMYDTEFQISYTSTLSATFSEMNNAISSFSYEGSSVSVPYEYDSSLQLQAQ